MLWIFAIGPLGLWLASAPPACADPAVAAITYLEKILKHEVDLDVGTDTAITPHVGFGKKTQIKEWLSRMAIDLKSGELEPGKIRIDGNLAGVIVHKRDGYDPEKVAAFAVALVKSGDQWVPAPVTASFENTGASFDLEMRRRAAELERWMLRERSRALDTLRDEQIDLMRKDIVAAITHEQLQTMSVGEMARTFLTATRNRDRLRLLGMLGGLSDPLPRDWATRLRASELAITTAEEQPKPWRILTNQIAPRAIVLEETGVRDGLFTIGYIDPAGEAPRGGVPPVELFHIDMERDAAGAWRLNLPAAFHDHGSMEKTAADEDNPFDVELLDAFPKRLREAQPATPQKTPEALWERMKQTMSSNSPDDLLRLLALPVDNPQQARTAIARVARLWWRLRFANGGQAVLPLAFHQDGDQAMAMAQLYAFREPERTDLRTFHMVRMPDGWMWQSTGKKDPQHPVSESLAKWRSEQEEHWREHWIATILEPTIKIQTLTPASPVDGSAAEALVRGLLDAIAAGDLNACLGKSAVLDDDEGRVRLLRNLGYEIATQITEIEGNVVTRSGNHWTVICFRRRDDANPGMALIPIITTTAGPRVLLELDLFVGTRQRDFLNNVAIERLEGYANDEVRADLQGILRDLNREFAPRRQ